MNQEEQSHDWQGVGGWGVGGGGEWAVGLSFINKCFLQSLFLLMSSSIKKQFFLFWKPVL